MSSMSGTGSLFSTVERAKKENKTSKEIAGLGRKRRSLFVIIDLLKGKLKKLVYLPTFILLVLIIRL